MYKFQTDTSLTKMVEQKKSLFSQSLCSSNASQSGNNQTQFQVSQHRSHKKCSPIKPVLSVSAAEGPKALATFSSKAAIPAKSNSRPEIKESVPGDNAQRKCLRKSLLASATPKAVRAIQDFHRAATTRASSRKRVRPIVLAVPDLWKKARTVLECIRHTRHLAKEVQLYGNPSRPRDPFLLRSLLDNAAHLPRNSQDPNAVPLFMFHPNSIFSTVWCVVLSLMLMCSAFVVPFRLAFYKATGMEDLNGWDVVEFVTDALFAASIVITFFTAFYDQEGHLVTSRELIAKQYLASWFWPDLVVCIPFDLISYRAVGIAALKLLCLPRLYRFFKIFNLADHWKQNSFLTEVFGLNTFTLRLIAFAITLLFCVHLFACLFHTSTIYYPAYKTFENHLGLQDAPDWRRYLFCLHWAVATLTTVGYGDIHAFNNDEMLFSILWMVIGSIFYSLYLGTVSSLSTIIDRKGSVLSEKLLIMNALCEESQFDQETKVRLREAIEYSTQNYFNTFFENGELLGGVSIELRHKVAMTMQSGMLHRIDFFQSASSILLDALLEHLRPRKLEAGEIVYRRREPADESTISRTHKNALVYFISEGRVDFYLENLKRSYKTMAQGSYFGDCEVIFNTSRLHTARARTEVALLCLSKRAYVNVIEKRFQKVAKLMREVAAEKSKRTRKCLRLATRHYIDEMIEAQNESDADIDILERCGRIDDVLNEINDPRDQAALHEDSLPHLRATGYRHSLIHAKRVQTLEKRLESVPRKCKPISTFAGLTTSTFYDELGAHTCEGTEWMEPELGALQNRLAESIAAVNKANEELRRLEAEHRELLAQIEATQKSAETLTESDFAMTTERPLFESVVNYDKEAVFDPDPPEEDMLECSIQETPQQPCNITTKQRWRNF